MKPLIVLLGVFIMMLVLKYLFKKNISTAQAGSVAMGVMLIFTGISHFVFTAGMRAMIPDFIPAKVWVVYFTGVLEFAFAVAICLPKYASVSAKLLIVFFVLILPANIYAAMHHINFLTGESNGDGLAYLWFRVPLQIFFIGWTYYFGIKKQGKHKLVNHYRVG